MGRCSRRFGDGLRVDGHKQRWHSYRFEFNQHWGAAIIVGSAWEHEHPAVGELLGFFGSGDFSEREYCGDQFPEQCALSHECADVIRW